MVRYDGTLHTLQDLTF